MTPEHTVVVVPAAATTSSFGSTLAAMLVVVALTCVAIFFFMKHRKAKEQQRIQEEQRMSFEQLQSIIYEEIQDVCELTLVRENFTSTVSVDVDKKIPFLNVHMPGSSRKFLMDYSGTIVCGFDWNDVKVMRDGTFGNKVKIFLPSSKILDIYADVSSFNIHLQDAGLLASKITLEEQNAWVAEDVAKQGRRAVREDGLLLRADDNARKFLLSKLNSRGLPGNFDLDIVTLNAGNNVRQLTAPE